MNFSTLYSFFCTCLLFFLAITGLSAQPGTTTELEVNNQKIFIEANKQKILENYEMAASLFKEVLKTNPENHAAAYELARVYDVMDNDEKALNSIKIAVNLQPENMWYQLFLADVYDKAKKYDGAADIYKRMVEKYPSTEYHYFKYAYFLVKDNKQEEAIKLYNVIEKKFGVNEEVSRRKHSLYLGLGDEKNATKEIQALIAFHPQSVKYRHLLADFFTSQKKLDKANEVYQEILEIDPLDAKAKLALAGKNKSEGGETAYLKSLDSVIKQEGESIDLKVKALMPYITKMSTSNDDTFIAEALKLGKSLTEVHPDDPKAFALYGDMLYQTGQNKAALNSYQKSIDINGNTYSVWEQMLYIHAESYEMEEMRDLSEKAMDVFPNHGKLFYFNGISLTELDDHSAAANSLEQALLMSGKNNNLKADILARLTRSYAHQNKIEKANKKIEKALNLKPDDFRVQDAKAFVLYKSKSFDESKNWFEKSMKNGGDQNFEVLEHFGDLLFEMDEAEKAFEYWSKAKELGGKSDRLNKKIISKQL